MTCDLLEAIIKNGGALMSQIFCSVSNCHYYGQNNICHANQIMVASDSMAHKRKSKAYWPVRSRQKLS